MVGAKFVLCRQLSQRAAAIQREKTSAEDAPKPRRDVLTGCVAAVLAFLFPAIVATAQGPERGPFYGGPPRGGPGMMGPGMRPGFPGGGPGRGGPFRGPGGGPGFRGGGERGGFRGGPPFGRSFGPGRGDSDEERVARFARFLRSMDANGDGTLTPGELPESRRGFLEFLARRYGLDPNKPIRISTIRERMIRRYSSERSGGGSPTSDRSERDKQEKSQGKKQQDQEPLVPGFGVPQEVIPVPGFGERVELASIVRLRSSIARRSGSGRSERESRDSDRRSRGSDREERYRRYAEYMLRRYDRNNNGKLEKSEWDALRERGRDPEQYDKNRDGVITREEMTAAILEYARRRETGEDSDGGSDSQNRKSFSYRLRTVAELLPEGLPEWFIERDANKDGQVAMAEYSSMWSEAKVREFLHYDLNGDGIITPEECLNAPEEEVSSEQTVASVESRSGTSAGSGTSSTTSSGTSSRPWWMTP